MTSRRTLMSAGLAAIPVGVGAGLGVHRWLAGGTSLRLLGRESAMMSLFDTGNERVLFLLGEPDFGLLENISHLLPIGRSRLDMIVGNHSWLTLKGARNYLDLDIITTLSTQASASAPPIRGNVHPVTSSLTFQLGTSSDVLLAVGRDTDTAGTNPSVSVRIDSAGARLVLASGVNALGGIETGLNLLVLPGEVGREEIETLSPEVFAGTSLPADTEVPGIQLFPDDPVIFAVEDGSVTIRKDQFFS